MVHRTAKTVNAMNSDLRSHLRTLWRNAERGEDASFEFTVWIVPLMMMIALIAFATLVRASQVPAWTAASECARTAIATLDSDIGVAQGEAAGWNSLRGNYISTAAASVRVTFGAWEPGSDVTCTVNYGIDLSGIFLLDGLVPGNSIPMQAAVTLRVEPTKSRWS